MYVRKGHPHCAKRLGDIFKGFEVAFKRRKIDDAILYLNNMKKEIDYSIQSLEPSGKKAK